MVNHSSTSLDTTFSALSDPTRRAILYRLSRRDLSVKELAKPFKISPPAISKHLRVLEKAGLLKREKHGRVHLCRLVARPIKDAAQWTDHYRHFWEGRFDDLANYLNRPHKKKEKL